MNNNRFAMAKNDSNKSAYGFRLEGTDAIDSAVTAAASVITDEFFIQNSCRKSQKGVYLHRVKSQKGVYLHRVKSQKGVKCGGSEIAKDERDDTWYGIQEKVRDAMLSAAFDAVSSPEY